MVIIVIGCRLRTQKCLFDLWLREIFQSCPFCDSNAPQPLSRTQLAVSTDYKHLFSMPDADYTMDLLLLKILTCVRYLRMLRKRRGVQAKKSFSSVVSEYEHESELLTVNSPPIFFNFSSKPSLWRVEEVILTFHKVIKLPL